MFGFSFVFIFLGKSTAQEFPETQWADNANTDWYDSSQSSFDINNGEGLAGLSVLVADGNDFENKTINIINDINLDGNLWQPIGVDIDHAFMGTVNGGGNTIANIYVNEPEKDFGGLFGAVLSVYIYDLNIDNTLIYAQSTVGALVGNLSTDSTVENCHVTNGFVQCESGWDGGSAGGLAGGLLTNSTILKSSFSGEVHGGDQIGGLVGTAWDSTSIEESYTEGLVVGDNIVGGLVGYTVFNFPPNPSVTNVLKNSYSRADVLVSGMYAGGIYGYAEDTGVIENCYSTGNVVGGVPTGGAFGSISMGSTAINTYFDTETSGQSEGFGENNSFEEVHITGKTSEEMQSEDFADLLNSDGGDIWSYNLDLNDGYPILTNNHTLSIPSFEKKRWM